MTTIALSAMTAYGVHLVYTALAFGWSGLRLGPPVHAVRGRRRRWMNRAGLDAGRGRERLAVGAVMATVSAALAFACFGGVVAPLAAAVSAASVPAASTRASRRRRRAEAREAWPRMIEEIRVLTGAAGRSVPQALLEAGLRTGDELRPAFVAAQREWLLSTDFARTVAVLKERLDDATADAACETLLVAHEVGGTDVDRRLAALVEDRVLDLQGRKDAEAAMAGARFARRFVLVVPLGMAFVGLSIGTGRAAYASAEGQAAVAIGIALLAACWAWSGRVMRLPDEERVFA